jgi:hypothetical protein
MARKLTMIAKRTNVSAATTNLTFTADFSFPFTPVSPLGDISGFANLLIEQDSIRREDVLPEKVL